MSAHVERARLLLAQSRPADAEQELLLELALEPHNPPALALLAFSRVNQGKNAAALASAEEAVGIAPDVAYLHYVRALVLHRLEREDDALAAVNEALRLDPNEPEHFRLLGTIELGRRNWTAALQASEAGLALDPEHVDSANMRSMALVQLGRKEEAMATVDFALEREPDNALSHANQGWNCLHRNDPRRALEHFREALRLDPELEYARNGMLEALKARNPVYRGMLAYFLWMGRLSRQMQWGFIIALWFGTQFVYSATKTASGHAWIWWTLLGLIYGFIYLSWTAQPLFNLLLRLNRFGRHVLSRDQRTASHWFGAFFLGALVNLAWWATTGHPLGLILLIGCLALSICIAATFNRSGRGRRWLAIGTGTLGAIGVAGLAFLFLGRGDLANALVLAFVYGFIAFQLLANFLSR